VRLPADGLAGQRARLLDFVHADDRDRVALALEAQARAGECQVEFRVLTAGGACRWVWTRLFPAADEAGGARVAGITEDITDRKTKETTLQSARNRLWAVLDAFPDVFFLLEGDGTILDFHAGRTEDLVLRPDQFLGCRIQELGRGEASARFAEALARAQSTSGTATFEYSLPVRGTAQHFEARCIPLPNRRLAAFIRNITASKENEATLRDSQRKISSLIDTLPGIVFSSTNDAAGSLTYLSEGVCQLTGYRREELLLDGGKSFWAMLHGEDWSRAHGLIGRALQSRQPYLVEYRARTRAGRERWFWERGRGVYGLQGELLGREGFIMDITERRQAEETLWRETELLRGAAQAAQHLLTETDFDAAIHRALAALGVAAGVDRAYLCENVAGEPGGGLRLRPRLEWTRDSVPPSVCTPTDGADTYEALGLGRWQSEFLAGNPVCGVLDSFPPEEHAWLAADGVRSMLLLPIRVDGELYGFLGLDVCSDDRYWAASEQSVLKSAAAGFGGVLRRRRDQQALAAAERRYGEMFENSFEGIFQTTPDGRYLSANPALARIHGYESPEELMQNVTSLAEQVYVNPADHAEFRRQLEQEGVVQDFEVAQRRRDGQVIWVRQNARAVRNAQGEVLYFEGTAMDITARKEFEEALRDSELLYHSLVENLPVFIFRKDLDGRITFVNDRLCAYLGRSADQIVGKTDFDMFPREMAEVYRTGDLHVLQSGLVMEAEEDQAAPDGRLLRMHVIKSPLRDAKGVLIGVQGIFWDVTARHQAEAQSRESADRLELALKELKQTQKQLVQQERLHALGQMASGIAHDFNNTLMAITGFTELLLTHPETLDNKPKVVSYLKTMATAAKDAASVVKRLNEFYRHREEGEVFPPVDVAKLLQQAVSLTQPKWKDQAQASGVSIDVQLDVAEVAPVAAHESELRECLINLIFNAVDALPRGGRVTVGCRMEGDAVVIEVADTGAGMSEEVRKRCFEPFFSTKGQRGTGLGLAMVFGIIQRHQGMVDVQSDLGRGTRFQIKLPALRRISDQCGDTEILGRRARPLNVLVVDDEPVVRQILSEYLNTDGHTVVTANDGLEALQRFAEQHFDLVLTDRSMPHMSGDHLADAIKQVDPGRPVVLLTGFGDMMKATGQKPKGVDVVMSKPVTLNGLRVSLSEAVEVN